MVRERLSKKKRSMAVELRRRRRSALFRPAGSGHFVVTLAKREPSWLAAKSKFSRTCRGNGGRRFEIANRDQLVANSGTVSIVTPTIDEQRRKDLCGRASGGWSALPGAPARATRRAICSSERMGNLI